MKRLIVDTAMLRGNVSAVMGAVRTPVMAVVKGNGYGLGLLEYARFLRGEGIGEFAVSDLGDALALRRGGIVGPVLLLGSTRIPGEAEAIVAGKVTATVGSVGSATVLDACAARLGATVEAHVKVDTGFGRFGFGAGEADACAQALAGLRNTRITGVYTHFYHAFAAKGDDTRRQFDAFLAFVDGLGRRGFGTLRRHACNSAAALRFPEMRLDAVRIGSAFVGRLPSGVAESAGIGALSPIGQLRSEVVELRGLPKGSTVGYAGLHRLRRPTEAAIVPVGFGDGLFMERSNDTFRLRDRARYALGGLRQGGDGLHVMIGGGRARMIGRVGMHHVIADVTGMGVRPGDEAAFKVNPIYVDSSVVREYV